MGTIPYSFHNNNLSISSKHSSDCRSLLTGVPNSCQLFQTMPIEIIRLKIFIHRVMRVPLDNGEEKEICEERRPQRKSVFTGRNMESA